MATVFDVAKYILERMDNTTHMKLQKLVYYSQAWSLVWEEKALFDEKIEAWANGPVVPELFAALRGKFRVIPNEIKSGCSDKLEPADKETIDAVIGYYGAKNPQYLSDLTHMESPWQQARNGLGVGERGNNEITLASMAEYYESLQNKPNVQEEK